MRGFIVCDLCKIALFEGLNVLIYLDYNTKLDLLNVCFLANIISRPESQYIIYVIYVLIDAR